jgi:hypothetical protein
MAKKKDALIFFCDSFCTVSVITKKLKKNEDVFLIADGTTVTLTFNGSSPFVSNMDLTIPAGTFTKQTTVNRKVDVHYGISCSACGGISADPEIIVG